MRNDGSVRWARWTARSFDEGGSATTRVIVADDHMMAADASAAALDSAGFEAYAVYSGPEAVACCERVHAHVVLMDISMPWYDGFVTTGMMRRLKHTRDMIIVAYTAMNSEYVREGARFGDFDGYFQKGQSVAALAVLIGSFRLSRENYGTE